MIAAAVVGVVLIAGIGTLAWTYAALPDPNQLRHLRGDGLVVLDYADGTPLAMMGKRPGPFLQPSEVPETVRQGFLATEDIRFFEHKGVDWRGIGRALMVDLKSGGKGRIEGGSTITQQLVRNYFFKAAGEGEPRHRRGLTAKLREALMAAKLERAFSKYEILQAYMTVIQYGEGKWGVADAAEYYFGKDVRSVTLSEAAMIVGSATPPTPTTPTTTPPRPGNAPSRCSTRCRRLASSTKPPTMQPCAPRPSSPRLRRRRSPAGRPIGSRPIMTS